MSAYPPWTTLLVSSSGTAEAVIGTLTTTKTLSQGNALGLYVKNNDASQTVTFSIQFKPSPSADWVTLPALAFTEVAVGATVYDTLRMSVPVSGPLSLRLRAVASGAGSAPVDYRIDAMEIR